MGRPYVLNDDDVVFLSGDTAKCILQTASQRKALATLLFTGKGRLTVAEINEHFDFDCRAVIGSLMRSGWLKIAPPPAKKGSKVAKK